ncbi:MAG: ABC transporter ATP-binding protein [Candidatus Altiarchaeota archaeon]|nr:ABC transporter ATP-binding protein [Candidatus Altiarchaeota archaeon]
MIKIHDLDVDVGEFHLRDINIEIKKGEYFVILGPTGSGKTVLVECMAGIHNPCKGEIWFNDGNVTLLTPEERETGYVPQDYVLFPHLNALENIQFGLKIKNHSKKEIEKRVGEVTNRLNIKNILYRQNPKTLSGGEKQRVALARALIIKPRLLILDEPLSALDPRTHEELQRELKRIHKEIKTTTIHVTHDFEEAISLGDRIAVMNNGKIIQIGTPDEIFRKPKTESVAKFVGAENLFKGKVIYSDNGKGISRIRIHGMDTNIFSLTEKVGAVYVSIHPEDIVLSEAVCKCYNDKNILKGKIVNIMDKGSLVRIIVDVSIPLTVLLTRRAYLETELKKGSEIYVIFKAMNVHVF